MLSVKNVSIVRVERKKFIFQNLPLDKSHFITGGIEHFTTSENILYALLSMIGIGLAGFCILYLYNGKQAVKGKNFSKWFFYTFYPAHLLILGIIRISIM